MNGEKLVFDVSSIRSWEQTVEIRNVGRQKFMHFKGAFSMLSIHSQPFQRIHLLQKAEIVEYLNFKLLHWFFFDNAWKSFIKNQILKW